MIVVIAIKNWNFAHLYHSGPRGGKSQKMDVLKSAYTKFSLKVDKIPDTMQKKLAQ